LVTTGTLDDALRHLERACELAPDYGHNHLALAKALLEDDQYDAAKTHLQKVIDLPNPDGDETERAKWVHEAQGLIRQL
jgi:tetratricopeptide (TPR) repeat protein